MNTYDNSGSEGTQGVFSGRREEDTRAVGIEKAVWPGWDTVRLLGSGGYGSVFEIEREIYGEKEKAALKVITVRQDSHEQQDHEVNSYGSTSKTEEFNPYLKSIVDEYSLMRKMNGSANIVSCDDVRCVQHDDGRGWDVFIKMELLTPLLKSLGTEPKVPEEKIIKIGMDICKALILCRKNHIVHRDIKPSNILVSKNGDYKLGDFGIAKNIEKLDRSVVSGSLDYMAPEVYHEEKYDGRVDIYSLGMVLYFLLNNRSTPFLNQPNTKSSKEEKKAARETRFRGENIPPPAHGSKQLKRIIQKACAFDPRERYQTPEEMLADLEKIDRVDVKWLVLGISVVILLSIIATYVINIRAGSVFVDSGSGVSIAKTVLFNEKGIIITALHYDAEDSNSDIYNDEYIAFRIENNSDEEISFPWAFVKINNLVVKASLLKGINNLAPHTDGTGLLRIDPEIIHLSSSDRIENLSVSCVVKDADGNEICSSEYMKIPVKDERDREYHAVPVDVFMIEEDILKINFLGYRIAHYYGGTQQIYLYLYVDYDEEENSNRYLQWYSKEDKEDDGFGVVVINGEDYTMYMDCFSLGITNRTGQSERVCIDSAYINDGVENIRKIEMPFSIYAIDWGNQFYEKVFSTYGITFNFDENGQLISYEGKLYKNEDSWNRYFS